MKSWIKSILSDEPGPQSSSRLLMLIFAAFSLAVLSAYFYVLLTTANIDRVKLMCEAMPYVFSGCAALLGIPYSVSKVSSSISDIVASIRGVKKD
jgi:hypothetical protein